jgi:hypothetical protein
MDMKHGHGHAPWTWTCTMDMDMHHGHGDGQAPWMPECRNADKKFSPASLVFRYFVTLSPASVFRHRSQSGTASHGLVR